ncbi:bifunctional diguanylate cyclase/phosphodiesterase [Halanaerobium congolense]|uniref:bifunctional diguanylate cyclase/phosphodiesterase n=1 Tax=Halanaerobium congolense TaxID=54121 RepID=UPI00091DA86A|nr:EAL domain-containing protein [Halanaerobium congolense]SHM84367.1 EAL domain, c-di-GMP-specific phosphodiesterase class I (or its enzymatically inactive variant) [Halanaerobium congolense]
MIKRQEIYLKLKYLKNRTVLLISAIFLLITFITFFVYQSGGTRFSYTYLVYIPIILAAYFYNIKGGLLAALIGGLFLGPLMPLNTATMVMQSFENWFFRMLLFMIIGSFSGALFSFLESQIEEINKIAYYYQETGLANLIKMKSDLEAKIENDGDFYLIIININNFLDIYKLIGFTNFSNYINKFVEHIRDFKNIKDSIYQLNENKYGLTIDKNKVDNFEFFLKEFVIYLEQAIDFKHVSIFNEITLGISTSPEQSQIADELINQSFLALEKAAEKRINYWIYEEQEKDLEYSDSNIEILAQVKNSITEDNFELYYQPKINLRTNEIEAFEALIRWHHPEKGFLTPDRFISIVEQSSLIESLTNWVIKEAAADLNIYKEKIKASQINLAINISARNLQQPEFTDNLIKVLRQEGVDPCQLRLEITETELMLDIKENIKKLKRLKDHGIQIYLDDFGKGYSSLKYLKELPVDFIKIDGYFIRSISIEESAENIIYSIINMAHALDLKVVAEGVENQIQLDFLNDLGCDFAQGYYFARPGSKEKIIHWIKNNNYYILK